MPLAQKAIEKFDQKELTELLNNRPVVIHLEGHPVTLTTEDVQVERAVHEGIIAANQGTITIALDTKLNEELLLEGLAKEKLSIKSTRCAAKLIFPLPTGSKSPCRPQRVMACFARYKDYICHEVLAVEVQFGSCEGTEWDLNGEPTTIAISRA